MNGGTSTSSSRSEIIAADEPLPDEPGSGCVDEPYSDGVWLGAGRSGVAFGNGAASCSASRADDSGRRGAGGVYGDPFPAEPFQPDGLAGGSAPDWFGPTAW
jgi:hypothetical protein